MELAIYNIEGKDTGKKALLSDEVFSITPNDHVIYLDVKQYLANKRQGTHKAKEKAEVSATTKKLKKQKGTGGARAGSMKSPLFVGGGRVFGPRPRDYGFKLNKKTKVLARKSALSYKVQDNALTVLDNVTFAEPKTKSYISFLNNLNISDKKTLLVLSEVDNNVVLSARNLQNCEVVVANNINTYQILNADNLLLTVGAIEKLQNLLSE
ncbi:MAG: 50S ribosomal protein L4 [Cytophagales bacterium]